MRLCVRRNNNFSTGCVICDTDLNPIVSFSVEDEFFGKNYDQICNTIRQYCNDNNMSFRFRGAIEIDFFDSNGFKIVGDGRPQFDITFNENTNEVCVEEA